MKGIIKVMLNVAIVGCGNIAQTSYIPAFKKLAQIVTGVETNKERRGFIENEFGIPCVPTIRELPPQEMIVIATPPHVHLENTKAVLAQHWRTNTKIICEKPATIKESQLPLFREIIEQHSNLLLADHWYARLFALADMIQTHIPQSKWGHISQLSGYLIEPSTTNEKGEPCPLDFSTGKPDERPWIHEHPNGVVLDTAIHPANLLLGLTTILKKEEQIIELNAQESQLTDRFGHSIKTGNHSTAEGHAILHGQINHIPTMIEVNKYGGQESKKGCIVEFNNGCMAQVFRSPQGDVYRILSSCGGVITEKTDPRPLYQTFIEDFLLNSRIFDATKLLKKLNFNQINLIECLLKLQQTIRG